ncbi:uncharacterized protein LOC102156997 isoform X7 [Canis lupus familiaris]|uniref:uncharacterized protein LOC102156997 isoform X7 n=1 Tax=Canis lupus familiaris TaxID=9615 RepID=UPI0018F51953|nr:uncharacterized protein LOC102156997 isoform X7 [Canis lupus familiaris]XP_038312593.1 uncharacterized protein LOC102156997 isoform X7 [Canis lupus familiaris]XP_038312594.1 uncharacterized protein LOC102156997 isoform X7 [Canis lupus familiaris]XP_038312595.1 uncharacterized protein LOC102156997 isoform X7 [Canis lupus familiaris]XP_038312596.1 uncharacterized protein LOC102156997 isoform X7 [Canis lupus familiaris]XP_038312597.1 uncharacterized protein LOC102156997 isoform X7 [Canis lupus
MDLQMKGVTGVKCFGRSRPTLRSTCVTSTSAPGGALLLPWGAWTRPPPPLLTVKKQLCQGSRQFQCRRRALDSRFPRKWGRGAGVGPSGTHPKDPLPGEAPKSTEARSSPVDLTNSRVEMTRGLGMTHHRHCRSGCLPGTRGTRPPERAWPEACKQRLLTRCCPGKGELRVSLCIHHPRVCSFPFLSFFFFSKNGAFFCIYFLIPKAPTEAFSHMCPPKCCSRDLWSVPQPQALQAPPRLRPSRHFPRTPPPCSAAASPSTASVRLGPETGCPPPEPRQVPPRPALQVSAFAELRLRCTGRPPSSRAWAREQGRRGEGRQLGDGHGDPPLTPAD